MFFFFPSNFFVIISFWLICLFHTHYWKFSVVKGMVLGPWEMLRMKTSQCSLPVTGHELKKCKLIFPDTFDNSFLIASLQSFPAVHTYPVSFLFSPLFMGSLNTFDLPTAFAHDVFYSWNSLSSLPGKFLLILWRPSLNRDPQKVPLTFVHSPGGVKYPSSVYPWCLCLLLLFVLITLYCNYIFVSFSRTGSMSSHVYTPQG